MSGSTHFSKITTDDEKKERYPKPKAIVDECEKEGCFKPKIPQLCGSCPKPRFCEQHIYSAMRDEAYRDVY